MLGSRPLYVVDTNVLVDYPGIIPGILDNQPEEPTIDLTGAHIVIPTAVVRELSSFKKEKSDRGKVARVMLKQLREMVEGKVQSLSDIYGLQAPITIESESQLMSILPVHKDFKKCLPFSPSEDDMDGQIILATLVVKFLLHNMAIDGTENRHNVMTGNCADEVILLTNDNGLAIRARERSIRTERYGYKYPDPYTGRRDLVVPRELFIEFYDSRRLDRAAFEKMMPNEPRLVANEFIVMSLDDPCDYPSDFSLAYNPKFSHIGRYDVYEDAIVPLRYVESFPAQIKTAGQAIYAEALADPNIAAVICTGPAGSGKTYMATVYGYIACKNGDYIGVTVVPCESHSKIGALPGDLSEKMDPDLQPLKNALRNYLLNEDTKLKKELETLRKFGTNAKCKRNADCDEETPDKRSIKVKLKDRVELIWNNWFSSVPIESARGRDFSYEIAIYDEFQDQNISQADTLVKRIGFDGKIILTGDIRQIHAPYLDEHNNGLVYASRTLYDDPMVAQVNFTEEEVVRHPLVKMIAMRQAKKREQRA